MAPALSHVASRLRLPVRISVVEGQAVIRAQRGPSMQGRLPPNGARAKARLA